MNMFRSGEISHLDLLNDSNEQHKTSVESEAIGRQALLLDRALKAWREHTFSDPADEIKIKLLQEVVFPLLSEFDEDDGVTPEFEAKKQDVTGYINRIRNIQTSPAARKEAEAELSHILYLMVMNSKTLRRYKEEREKDQNDADESGEEFNYDK